MLGNIMTEGHMGPVLGYMWGLWLVKRARGSCLRNILDITFYLLVFSLSLCEYILIVLAKMMSMQI